MPTTVLLIRHPESAWNRKGIYQGQHDIALSPLGRIQAELVAARLSREHISGIICSPLRRARVLAQAIARYHHLPAQPDERLTEISHGSWEGLSRHEVLEQFPDMYETWIERPHEVQFPGGESLRDVHERSVEPIAELLGRPDDSTWVVVTHDTVARLVIAAADERPVEGFSAVSLENAGITTLHGPTLVGSVRHVNDVDHLGEHRVNLETQAL
ncbi:MAG TPA: histidine phosphatase family protein [Chloroflexota bacterium]